MTRRSIAVLSILLISLTVVSGFLVPFHPRTINVYRHRVANLRFASTARPFDYILIVMMENKNFSQINGNPQAPYLNQLAQNYSLATHYTACDHPSLPNYMCLTGGYNYFSGQDCFPSGACTTSNSSIVDRIESAGMTWKAYMEDMPSPCFKSGFGNYTYLTNPFIFYKDVATNSTRCAAHDVPANSGGKGLADDNLVNALGSTSTASNFMWLTPNLCDNMHNCSISRGDSYLSKLVPSILNSYIFKTQRAVLFITFDEGYGKYPTDYVFSVWAGPAIRSRFFSTNLYSHYSVPSTIEVAWGLKPITPKDATAATMMEFVSPFIAPKQLVSTFTFSPVSPDIGVMVNFSAVAIGGAPPYQFNWTFGDNSSAIGQTVDHIFHSPGNITTSLFVIDSYGQASRFNQVVSVDNDPISVGPCEGCKDGLFQRTTGILISVIIGILIPIIGSALNSRRKTRARLTNRL